MWTTVFFYLFLTNLLNVCEKTITLLTWYLHEIKIFIKIKIKAEVAEYEISRSFCKLDVWKKWNG